MSSNKSAMFSLHLSALLMGATGLFSKIIQLPAWDITGYRTWVAAMVLFAWVWWRERSLSLQAPRDYGRMLILGALLGLHWIAFFHSMQISSIAVGMISLYAFPVMTVFLEPWLKATRLDWRDIVSGLFVLVGIYFLVPEFSVDNTTTQGVLWGIFAAFTFALRNVLLGLWFSYQSASRSMAYQVFVVALLMTPVIVLSSHQPRAVDWWLLLGLGVVFTAFTHTLFGHALRYLKATTVGVVACMQPVYAVIYGMVILHAMPDLPTVFGGAIIMAAALYESVSKHRKPYTLPVKT